MNIKTIKKKAMTEGWDKLTNEEREHFDKYWYRKREIRAKHWKDERHINMKNIDELENARSSRSKCKGCGEIIGKNTIRGVKNVPKPQYKFIIRNKFCSRCACKWLIQDIKNTKETLKFIRRRMRTRKKAYQDEKELRMKTKLMDALE